MIGKTEQVPVGISGFVRRETLPGPDIGFAFLPEHEGKGYGYESAVAVLGLGRNTLGFETVYAIATHDNRVSHGLLYKLGFRENGVCKNEEGEGLTVFKKDL